MSGLNGFLILLSTASFCCGDIQYISSEKSSEETIEKYGESTGAKETSCPCGWSNKERVVKGKKSAQNEFPFQVALMDRTSKINPICGASIITENHVLTASHCTHEKSSGNLYVVLGAHNIQKGDPIDRTLTINVREIIMPKDFDEDSYKSDIAILVMEKSIQFSKFIGRICMPSSNESLINQYVKVAGWGLIQRLKPGQGEANMKFPESLMKVNLHVIPVQVCLDFFENAPIDPSGNREVCTYRLKKDTCQGDSGGPLLWMDPDTNRFTQVGIISYGVSCAKKIPGVSTKVYYYMKWIQDSITSSKIPGTLCYKL